MQRVIVAIAAIGMLAATAPLGHASATDAVACPTRPPAPPEVVIFEAPAPSPPVARVPLEMRMSDNGELRLLNVFAAPTFVEPEFHAVFEAGDAPPALPPCWRVVQIQVWLRVTAAELQVPREFAGMDCLDRSAVAGGRAFYAGTVAAVREFFERARPAVARHSAAFGWTRAGDKRAALAAYNAWLRPRLPELWEASKTEAGGEPRLPTEAAGFDAAQRACPDFIEELRRFRSREDERRGLGGRL